MTVLSDAGYFSAGNVAADTEAIQLQGHRHDASAPPDAAFDEVADQLLAGDIGDGIEQAPEVLGARHRVWPKGLDEGSVIWFRLDRETAFVRPESRHLEPELAGDSADELLMGLHWVISATRGPLA